MHCSECSAGTQGLVGYAKLEGERHGAGLTESKKEEGGHKELRNVCFVFCRAQPSTR